MNLAPPSYTFHFDIESRKFVAQSVYKDGKTLQVIATADMMNELFDKVLAWRYAQALDRFPAIPGLPGPTSTTP